MNVDQLTPWLVAGGLVALLVLWMVVRGARRRAAKATKVVTRMGGNAGRALVATLVIGGLQWFLLTHNSDPRMWAAVLGVPALFSAAQFVQMFTSTHHVHSKSKGGRR